MSLSHRQAPYNFQLLTRWIVFLVWVLGSLELPSCLGSRFHPGLFMKVIIVLFALGLNFVIAPAFAWLLTVVIPLDRSISC